VTAIAAGGSHTVALKNDGTVVAWGSNYSGQTNVPAGLTGVTAIAAGGSHTVALKNDGTVVAWGGNYFGQTNVPAGLSGVTAIVAGDYHTLALKSDGSAVGWGWNFYGQTKVPPGLSDVTAIAAGGVISMALKNDGAAMAWGFAGASPIAAQSAVVAIAAGSGEWSGEGDYYGGHTVALKNDGTVVAWGLNNIGQVTGIPTPTTGLPHDTAPNATASPVALGSQVLSGVTAIAAGDSKTLALIGMPSVNRAPSPVAEVSPLFVIVPDETNQFILAPNNAVATVVLDGSQSSDADNDPLQFSWYADCQTNPLATDALATIPFAVGPHTVQLVVSDGHQTATAQASFEVITPATAVGQLMLLVNEAHLGSRNKQPLLATLSAAVSSFDRGNLTAPLNQLSAFQNKVRAQVVPWNPALASEFTVASQKISDVVSGR
jgi:hypothetical protein